jgi:hypothetical protein
MSALARKASSGATTTASVATRDVRFRPEAKFPHSHRPWPAGSFLGDFRTPAGARNSSRNRTGSFEVWNVRSGPSGSPRASTLSDPKRTLFRPSLWLIELCAPHRCRACPCSSLVQSHPLLLDVGQHSAIRAKGRTRQVRCAFAGEKRHYVGIFLRVAIATGRD